MVVGAIIDRAGKQGLKRIVILEHVPEMPRYSRRVAEGKLHQAPRPQIDAIYEDIQRWRSQSPVRVFLGAEIDANPTRRDGRLLLLDLENIDVVIASTHFLPEVPIMWFEAPEFPAEQRQRLYEEWMVWILHIAANPVVDVLAHPGAEMAHIGALGEFSGRVLEDFEKLLRVCRKHHTAFEINETIAAKVPRKYLDSYTEVLVQARDFGVKFSLGSDAHNLDQIGVMPWVETIVAKLELGPEHYFHPQRKG